MLRMVWSGGAPPDDLSAGQFQHITENRLFNAKAPGGALMINRTVVRCVVAGLVAASQVGCLYVGVGAKKTPPLSGRLDVASMNLLPSRFWTGKQVVVEVEDKRKNSSGGERFLNAAEDSFVEVMKGLGATVVDEAAPILTLNILKFDADPSSVGAPSIKGRVKLVIHLKGEDEKTIAKGAAEASKSEVGIETTGTDMRVLRKLFAQCLLHALEKLEQSPAAQEALSAPALEQ